jgi:hypothetical protein
MRKLFSYAALTAGLLAVPALASAGDLNLTIVDGRVTLVAQDVTVRQILAEWARIGQTKIVNADKLIGPPLTLELRDVPEGQALETVLRSAAGYVVAPRLAGATGTSNFDSIVILATSRAPAVTQAPPSPFINRPAQPQPMMPQVTTTDDDDTDPNESAPGPGPTGAQFPGAQQFPGPGQVGTPQQGQPQQPGQPQGPMTAPRPGQLPAQPNQGQNPYTPGMVPPRPNPTAVPRPGGGSGGN